MAMKTIMKMKTGQVSRSWSIQETCLASYLHETRSGAVMPADAGRMLGMVIYCGHMAIKGTVMQRPPWYEPVPFQMMHTTARMAMTMYVPKTEREKTGNCDW